MLNILRDKFLLSFLSIFAIAISIISLIISSFLAFKYTDTKKYEDKIYQTSENKEFKEVLDYIDSEKPKTANIVQPSETSLTTKDESASVIAKKEETAKKTKETTKVQIVTVNKSSLKNNVADIKKKVEEQAKDKFYVQFGSYGIEANAKKVKEELDKKHKIATKITKSGSNYIITSVKMFQNKEDIKKYLQNVKQSYIVKELKK